MANPIQLMIQALTADHRRVHLARYPEQSEEEVQAVVQRYRERISRLDPTSFRGHWNFILAQNREEIDARLRDVRPCYITKIK